MTESEQRQYPNIARASYLDVVIHPGDMIYIPSGWWHYLAVWNNLTSPRNVAQTAVSVAARSYSTCEGLSYTPNFVVNWIHSLGYADMTGFCVKPEGLF